MLAWTLDHRKNFSVTDNWQNLNKVCQLIKGIVCTVFTFLVLVIILWSHMWQLEENFWGYFYNLVIRLKLFYGKMFKTSLK